MNRQAPTRFRGRAVAMVAIAVLVIAGCASTATVPIERIGQADNAITEARQHGAAVNAPVELKIAEDKVTDARNALMKEDHDRATRLAEQAQTDAAYARVRGESAKAQQIAQDMRVNIQNLRQELERLSQ